MKAIKKANIGTAGGRSGHKSGIFQNAHGQRGGRRKGFPGGRMEGGTPRSEKAFKVGRKIF